MYGPPERRAGRVEDSGGLGGRNRAVRSRRRPGRQGGGRPEMQECSSEPDVSSPPGQGLFREPGAVARPGSERTAAARAGLPDGHPVRRRRHRGRWPWPRTRSRQAQTETWSATYHAHADVRQRQSSAAATAYSTGRCTSDLPPLRSGEVQLRLHRLQHHRALPPPRRTVPFLFHSRSTPEITTSTQHVLTLEGRQHRPRPRQRARPSL